MEGTLEVSDPSSCLKQGQLRATSAAQGFIQPSFEYLCGWRFPQSLWSHLPMVTITVNSFFLGSKSIKHRAPGQRQPSAQKLYLYFLLEIKLKSCFHCLSQCEKCYCFRHTGFYAVFPQEAMEYPKNMPWWMDCFVNCLLSAPQFVTVLSISK